MRQRKKPVAFGAAGLAGLLVDLPAQVEGGGGGHHAVFPVDFRHIAYLQLQKLAPYGNKGQSGQAVHAAAVEVAHHQPGTDNDILADFPLFAAATGHKVGRFTARVAVAAATHKQAVVHLRFGQLQTQAGVAVVQVAVIARAVTAAVMRGTENQYRGVCHGAATAQRQRDCQ